MLVDREKISSLGAEELIVNPHMKISFPRNALLGWLKNTPDKLHILRNNTPLTALANIQNTFTLTNSPIWQQIERTFFDDANLYRACSNRPNISIQKIVFGICTELMGHINMSVHDPKLFKRLHRMRKNQKLNLNDFIVIQGFNALRRDARMAYDYSPDAYTFIKRLRLMSFNYTRRCIKRLTGRDVFVTPSLNPSEDAKWRHDLYAAVCEEIDKRYEPHAKILMNQWERNLKASIRSHFLDFINGVEEYKKMADTNKDPDLAAEFDAFKKRPFGQFVYSPQWEEFCQTMLNPHKPIETHAVLSFKTPNQEREFPNPIVPPQEELRKMISAGLRTHLHLADPQKAAHRNQ